MWRHPKQLNKIEDFSRPIIYWTWNNKCGVFKDNVTFYGHPDNVGTLEQHIDSWMWKCKKYNIKWWQFQDEIAPVGLLGFSEGNRPYGCEEEQITRELWEAIGNDDKELQTKLIKEIMNNENIK